jgi:hypothetical protein
MTNKKYRRRSRTKNEISEDIKKKKNNIYFGPIHEEAIIKYGKSNNKLEREKLYREIIEPVFQQMIDKMVFTYKFNALPNIGELKEECKGWLTTILDKFNPDKGYKAFSYFSVVTKNWFIHKIKKNNDKMKKEEYLEDIKKEIVDPKMIVHNDFDEKYDLEKYLQYLNAEMIDWRDDENLKATEKKVVHAIMILFENPNNIDIFNKKAIFLYIREITGLNTKQIASSLTILKQRYKSFRLEWNEE